MSDPSKTSKFDTKKSLTRALSPKRRSGKTTLSAGGKAYEWGDGMERVGVIRDGIPYESIEIISNRMNRPIKSILEIIGIPQTSYNKKKSTHSLLGSRESELVILITELLDFGIDVFNGEKEKFQHWLQKPNPALGGNLPEALLDTISGINEVRYCLNRIEYGNFA